MLLLVMIWDNVVANFARECYLVCRQHLLINNLWFTFILNKMFISGFYSISQSLLAFDNTL